VTGVGGDAQDEPALWISHSNSMASQTTFAVGAAVVMAGSVVVGATIVAGATVVVAAVPPSPLAGTEKSTGSAANVVVVGAVTGATVGDALRRCLNA